MSRHWPDSESFSSSVSLPSLSVSTSRNDKLFLNHSDFSGSVPSYHGRKYDIWGSDTMPSMSRYGSLFDDIDRQQSFHETQVREEAEKVEEKEERRRSTQSKGRRSSLLAMGYQYKSEADLLKPTKKHPAKVTLKPAKKISKHSTTIRKLKPEEEKKKAKKEKKEVIEHTRIPGPLPRVLQRAKIQRMISRAAENITSSGENRRTVVKKTLSLKDMGKEVVSAIRYDALNPRMGIKHWDKYFGDVSKSEFYRQYHIAGRNLGLYPKAEDLPEDKKSPRARYLRLVTERNLTPMPLLLRKESNPKGIFLGHKGLGDAKMLPVIEVLEDLPTVETIDFSDNRLTDVSLMPLALKLDQILTLTHLDLSYNKIDESSAVIMDYLRNARCRLKTLVLNGADVDDSECGNLARAIQDNFSITTLSLTNNMIGAAELMNVVDPDLVTGGEALGEMLVSNTTITELDVSWNSIRMDSAITFAESLTTNNTLLILKLAYNAFGDLPTQYLGQALKVNETLKYLDISYNSINPRAATVLANALIQNESLDTLVIDGNVLGEVGAQALVAAVQRASGEKRVLSISFQNCDCTRESGDVFNAANPSGLYRVDLSEPYGQMVAEECLYLANYRAGCTLLRLAHVPEGTSQPIEIKLVRAGTKTESSRTKIRKQLEKLAKLVLDRPSQVATDGVPMLKAILDFFDLYPDDGFFPEILRVMVEICQRRSLMASDAAEFREDYTGGVLYHIFYAIFQIHDVDHSASMDLDEFLSAILYLGVEFDRKYGKKLIRDFDVDKSGTIDDQEFAMIMVNEFCRTDVARGELVEQNTKKPWSVPVTGELIVEVFYQCESASIYDVSHDEGIHSVIKAIHDAPTTEQREVIFEQATTSPYYFMSAQQALMLFEEMGKHDNSHLTVLSRVLPQLVTSEQCHRFVDSVLNHDGKFALRVLMGSSYNILMGLPTGHYFFDLRYRQRRIEGRSLSAIWAEEVKYMRAQGVDTSQRGNYSNFRNETIGGVAIALTSHWFASAPTTGKLRLDYVSTVRPKVGLWPLSNSRFEALKGILELPLIHKRMKDKEWLTNTPLDQMVHPALTLAVLKEHHIEYMTSCHHYHSIYPEERQRDVSRENYDPTTRPRTPDSLRDVEEKPSITKFHRIYPYAYSRLIELQMALPILYLSTEQVIDILLHFPEENYLRVQALVSMFSRIVDYDKNGIRILDILNSDEVMEVYHRLGILNVIDPLYPDRLYRLDLRRWEHRECCKIMIVLAMEEPGENWMNEEYRWSKYDGNVPGWTLPVNWTLADHENGGEGGPRRFGWVSFTYTSTNVGCAPVKSVRMELRKRVLCGVKRLN